MTRKAGTVAVAALLATLTVYLAETRNVFFDSRVYVGAIRYWFRDGGMVYDWMRPGNPYGFTYPPFAGLAMFPMAYLPLALVLIIATVGTLATTALLVWWLTGPIVRRLGWPTRFAVALAFCLAVAFEPVRETLSFGQVNTLLLALVAADLLVALPGGRKWAGIGIGLAAAIKLTPAVFVLYLLLTKRWRAAATATGTAAAATLLAGAIFPDESREFWTSALWDTNRVGVLGYFSNQSERGLLARLPIDSVATPIWIAGVVLTLAFWVWRIRRAPDDLIGGLALTGVLGCLISPVTWIHHCVWLLPAVVRCVDLTLERRPQQILGVSAYVLMTSHIAWFWEKAARSPLELVFGNMYVWFSLALLAWTPLLSPRKAETHDVGHGDSRRLPLSVVEPGVP